MTRQHIGRYKITGTLGEGGMGIVYSALDPKLERPVAIKTLRAASPDPVARERLAREARTAAAINHPAICQLYEIGEDNGELYLAMELLEGESLATRIARGRLATSEAVSIALSMLAGIDALHRHGVVHRDLKPSNVFLTPHGVKLLDFGVAAATGADAAVTSTRLTSPGMLIGTPQYCAPEQIRGEPADARTDIFAAGAIVYEMVAGQTPYGGHTTVEVFHNIMYDEPPVLTGGPAVSALDRVIHKALAKRRDDRYQTADAFAQELRSSLLLADTQPVAARAATRLIVLPFRILRPDAETDFLAFSLADAITSSLSALQPLVVRSSVVAGRFRVRHAGSEGARNRGRRRRRGCRDDDARGRSAARHDAAARGAVGNGRVLAQQPGPRRRSVRAAGRAHAPRSSRRSRCRSRRASAVCCGTTCHRRRTPTSATCAPTS